MESNKKEIYTIGYANKSIKDFIACLKKYKIQYLIDVRSEPYSKRFSDYDKKTLDAILFINKIKYVWFGNYFGARRKEEDAYCQTYAIDGSLRKQVSFQKTYKTDLFKEGVDRINVALSKNLNICFMCSEKEPVDCHRFWMVAFYFFIISKTAGEVINIVDMDLSKSFKQVLDEVDLVKAKKAFYNQHFLEIDGCSLLNDKKPLWIEKWAEFFDEREDYFKKQKYSNNLIGYIKGNEEYD